MHVIFQTRERREHAYFGSKTSANALHHITMPTKPFQNSGSQYLLSLFIFPARRRNSRNHRSHPGLWQRNRPAWKTLPCHQKLHQTRQMIFLSNASQNGTRTGLFYQLQYCCSCIFWIVAICAHCHPCTSMEYCNVYAYFCEFKSHVKKQLPSILPVFFPCAQVHIHVTEKIKILYFRVPLLIIASHFIINACCKKHSFNLNRDSNPGPFV